MLEMPRGRGRLSLKAMANSTGSRATSGRYTTRLAGTRFMNGISALGAYASGSNSCSSVRSSCTARGVHFRYSLEENFYLGCSRHLGQVHDPGGGHARHEWHQRIRRVRSGSNSCSYVLSSCKAMHR